MDTFTRAMLRVHGLPATLTAFITSIAVLFQSAMTSARTNVLVEIRARPTIAAFNRFIVASFENWISERLPIWCECTSVIFLSCAQPPPRLSRESVAQLLRVHYKFCQ